ncbi:sensor histidine kinase [Cohnella thermotolerans]|uniref:sensor histidine kinase n=1 Tax=Cohnella thermotolerans TaxID=329858 RepID=UPI000686D368|nr:sensor histidine kinase [Cohnella thermotolerans]
MKSKSRVVERTLVFYRYASLSLTSLVYLAQKNELPLSLKVEIVLAAFCLAGWATWVYRRYPASRFKFRAALAAETAGIVWLVVMNGGLKSSFLWCLLNPALIAAVGYSPAACWSLLASGLAVIVGVTSVLQPWRPEPIHRLLADAIPFLMLVFLIALALQLFAKINRDSAHARARMDESMEHLKLLYRIVETATRTETDNMARVFAEFALKLTKSDLAFFWDGSEAGGANLTVRGEADEATREALRRAVESNLDHLRRMSNASMLNLTPHGVFLATAVKSTARFRGVMGVRIGGMNPSEGRRWYAQQLSFLSELCAVIVERHHLNQAENQLMIIEEQNRIADEMHDSVSQHLFGIVYAIQSLIRQWPSVPESQAKEQLRLIQVSAQKASQELRSTIYSLSSRKNNGTTWIEAIGSYLDRLSKLHAIDIRFDVSGDNNRLPVQHQKALYRIVSEAAGNAIRHGLSSRIEVDLRMDADSVLLIVEDNGTGFQVNERRQPSKMSGLGLGNIQYLVYSMGGCFDISSSKGNGTRIAVRLPIVPLLSTPADADAAGQAPIHTMKAGVRG